MTDSKKILLDILKKLCVIDDNDKVGNVTIHLNSGAICKVTKQTEIEVK